VVSRTYAQFCGLAKALDIVGERWSLLVIRELLSGPKRYTDLLAGLPGIATDMLASRLRDLEAAGVITRRTLPPPAGSRVYELTPVGEALQPALIQLARWGIRLLVPNDLGAFQVHWLVLPLQMMFRPERAREVALTVQFEIDGDPLQVRIDAGALSANLGRADAADVTISADVVAITEVARDPAAIVDHTSSGRLRVKGSQPNLARVLDVFGLT
jgi:DNA-binding HxlR family transcriptional regulator